MTQLTAGAADALARALRGDRDADVSPDGRPRALLPAALGGAHRPLYCFFRVHLAHCGLNTKEPLLASLADVWLACVRARARVCGHARVFVCTRMHPFRGLFLVARVLYCLMTLANAFL